MNGRRYQRGQSKAATVGTPAPAGTGAPTPEEAAAAQRRDALLRDAAGGVLQLAPQILEAMAAQRAALSVVGAEAQFAETVQLSTLVAIAQNYLEIAPPPMRAAAAGILATLRQRITVKREEKSLIEVASKLPTRSEMRMLERVSRRA